MPTIKSIETISLTLTDNQLENFSVKNFSNDQLQQLAKIGLIALNNATKDTPEGSENEENHENTNTNASETSTTDDASKNVIEDNELIKSNDIDKESLRCSEPPLNSNESSTVDSALDHLKTEEVVKQEHS